MEKVVFFRRITVFIKDMVICSRANKEKLATAFPAAHVAPAGTFVGPQPILASPPIPEGTPWLMQPMIGGVTVQFNSNRVDIVDQQLSVESLTEQRLVMNLFEVLKQVLATLELTDFTRFAYSPICGVEQSEEFNVSDYFDALVKLNPFENSQAKERNVTFSYRISKEFGECDEMINLVCKLSEGAKMIDQSQNISNPCLIIENDFNTIAGIQERQYKIADIEEFLKNAVKWNVDAIENILN